MIANQTTMVRVLVLDAKIQSCLPVVKALRQSGHQVTVAESDPLCLGFFSRYPHRRICYRDSQNDPAGFLADLEKILLTREYDVLIPIKDVTAELIAKNKDHLKKYVHIALVDYPIFMRARDKSQTLKIAQQYGLPCPRTYFPEEMSLDEIGRLIDYPVLIKPNKSSGARGIVKANSLLELKKYYPLVLQQYGPCHIQEYIPQTGSQLKAQLFLDGNSNVKTCLVYQKLRYFPCEGGSTSLGCTILRNDIDSLATALLQAMEWSGYADLDLITDPRDGLVKIMEVNPRLTGSVKICFEAGVDFADMLVAYAMGWKIKAVHGYRQGVYLRNPGLDLVWFLKSKARFKTYPSWFWLWGKNLKYEILSLSDPGPGIAYLLENLRDLISIKARRYKYQRDFLGN